jgi:small subunit ribosomal protein S17
VSNDSQVIKKTRTGVVDKLTAEKTVSVSVKKRVRHPLYKKVINKVVKCLVHSEGFDLKVGDKVRIIACRPISKRKSWRIQNICN